MSRAAYVAPLGVFCDCVHAAALQFRRAARAFITAMKCAGKGVTFSCHAMVLYCTACTRVRSRYADSRAVALKCTWNICPPHRAARRLPHILYSIYIYARGHCSAGLSIAEQRAALVAVHPGRATPFSARTRDMRGIYYAVAFCIVYTAASPQYRAVALSRSAATKRTCCAGAGTVPPPDGTAQCL
eukprot:IDg12005t1